MDDIEPENQSDRSGDEDGWRGTILDEEQVRRHPETAKNVERISMFRRSIDNIDMAVIAMLAERFRITDAIGELKAQAGFAPEDPRREQEQLDRIQLLASQVGLDVEAARQYLHVIVDETKRRHERIARDAQ